MFRHSLDRNVPFFTAFNWFLLSLLAGSVNAGGLMACQRFVTHVTGFATLAGIEIAQLEWKQAFAVISVPCYFLMGVMISAYLVDRRVHLKRPPLYATVMFVVAICLIVSAIGGHLDYFGPFGDVANLKKDYLLLALLSMASGLQNAAITTASGSTVRTTHLTGLSTDFGIGVVRAFYADVDLVQREKMKRANWLRFGSFISFVLGSSIGAVLFYKFNYLGFLFPAALALNAVFQELHHHTHRELEEAADRLRSSGTL